MFVMDREIWASTSGGILLCKLSSLLTSSHFLLYDFLLYRFNENDCVNQSDIPQYVSLANFTPRPAYVVRYNGHGTGKCKFQVDVCLHRSMLRETAREDGFVYFTDFQEKAKEVGRSGDFQFEVFFVYWMIYSGFLHLMKYCWR